MRNLALSLGCLILSSTCLAQTANWVQVNPTTSPPARWLHGTAYDFIRGRTVVFGGTPVVVGPKGLADTWEYDGKTWTPIKPKNSPPGRTLTSMVYHFARLKTVLFGGSANGNGFGNNLGDTWTWDGNNWTQMQPNNSPRARSSPGLAYDSARQRTVLFGGEYISGARVFLNDTWEWDGVNWTQIKTTNSPPARYSMGLAYDSARKRIVLFGGYNGGVIQDTWEYDGKNWTQINPTTQPSARCCAAFAYDTARKRTVIFGGCCAYFQETWEYDGKTWAQIKPTTQPSGRYDFDHMVYDQRRQRMVLFGGRDSSGRILGDTWEYLGSQALTASPSTISTTSGGTHAFTLDAGTQHGKRLYWIFGSVTGTSPGVTLASAVGSVNIPLNPDPYTDLTIALANTTLLTTTRGALDTSGKGSASLNVPKTNITAAIGLKLYHAYLVYDAKNNFYMTSNPVTLTLAK